MIKDGIYEQIVNNQLGSQLASLNLGDYDIDLEHLEASDARKILTIYIAYVLEKGLRYLRDSFGSSKEQDSQSLIAQIRLCNNIINEIEKATGERDFRDLAILEKGEVLRSLYSKINNARSINNQKVVRPSTSLVESTLFTGSRQEPTMLSELKKEILSSDKVDLLISFIKWSAIVQIYQELQEFTSRPGTQLRVVATTYMKATDYKAIQELSKLPNTQIKINYETNQMRMHAKAYIFFRDTGFSTAYIGSSNLSNPALTAGLEWNIKVTEAESVDIIRKCRVTFESYWNNPSFEDYDGESEECRNRLARELDKVTDLALARRHLFCNVRPYPYQQEILDNLAAERDIYHHYKNLIVASTGVGKTIIAAFDFKAYYEKNPQAKLLFVAHRKEILEQSRDKFREVLNDFNFGDLYVDGHRPSKLNHLFMSIQSFNAAKFHEYTTRDYYDFVIVDEFHHAAANSYQGLLEYYQPHILLGLTATPERYDGKDIFSYFDNRIAAEMRLGEAIDRKLLCPFLYFGVSDFVDYSRITWRGGYDTMELEHLYTGDTKRANLVLNTVYQYVTDIGMVHGLGFCVSVKHAEYMAEFFNQHQIPALALSAQSPEQLRNTAKERLATGKVKFIFVVDLYNEGVDIPEINTVLFLRPTESATVFLQQLGRGLRLHGSKDYLTVLDFIGQAHKKYRYDVKLRAMIGSGRKSLPTLVAEGFDSLPRGCYIHLEQQAKEYILENLRQTTVDKRSLINQVRSFEEDTSLPLTLEYFLSYHNINIMDFYRADGSRSLCRLKRWAGLTPEQSIQDSPQLAEQEKKEIDAYKRIANVLQLDSQKLLQYWWDYINNWDYITDANQGAEKQPTVQYDSEQQRLMRNMLYYTLYRKTPSQEGFVSMEAAIATLLADRDIRQEFLDILAYKLQRIDFVPVVNEYVYECPLEVHCQYNIRQIMAAFGYYNEESAPEFREGVKYFADKKTDIFLINLNKSEKDFSPSTMYEDYAINDTLFHWQTQSSLSATAATTQRYINPEIVTSLFVREYKKTGSYTSAYTFLGNVDYVSHQGSKPVSFCWKLHQPIPARLLAKANKSVAI